MPTIWKNYRVKIQDLSEDQKERLFQICHTFRWCYNWGLNYCNESYAANIKKSPSFVDLCTALTEYKHTDDGKWLENYDTSTCRYALQNLRTAFERFFSKQCKYPKFKARKEGDHKFKVREDRFRIKDGKARIPGLRFEEESDNWVSLKNHIIPVGDKIKYHNIYIKWDGLNFWLSMSAKLNYPITIEYEKKESVGIDVGIRTSATLSNGITYDSPNHHRIKVLDHRKRKLAKAIGADRHRRYLESKRTKTKYSMIPKSNNEIKREEKYQKTLIQISNIYNSHYHKISRDIADQHYDTVVLETLRVKPMIRKKSPKNVKNSIYLGKMATLIRYIDYKCTEVGTNVVYAPAGYQSTKICSCCGFVYQIGSEKIYKCPNCGLSIDRDLNAAINLLGYRNANHGGSYITYEDN